MSIRTSERGRDRTIPPIYIQVVGLVLIFAVLAAGTLVKGANSAVLLTVVGAGVTLAMLGGAYEKARREMFRALRSLPGAEDDETKDPPSPEPGPS